MAKSRLCSIPACDKSCVARGYCKTHYYRLKKYGSPTAGKETPGFARRFIYNVAISYPGDDCLVWPYARDSKGYARSILSNFKSTLAHRIVCEIVHGAPPTPKHEAAHLCGNGSGGCVNPHHLSWKNHTENMLDKMIHGTHVEGERVGSAKIKECHVLEIRATAGKMTQRKIAAIYDISQQTVSDIQTRKIWRHI